MPRQHICGRPQSLSHSYGTSRRATNVSTLTQPFSLHSLIVTAQRKAIPDNFYDERVEVDMELLDVAASMTVGDLQDITNVQVG